jgi:predicted mannosyl-3-phosphoglycerate phosphatase (HAD superfamily)
LEAAWPCGGVETIGKGFRDLDPILYEDFNDMRPPHGNTAMKTGLTLTEVDERIAAIRENLEELVEQSAADSSAGDDDLNADRIAEQEKELAELTELREALLRK